MIREDFYKAAAITDIVFNFFEKHAASYENFHYDIPSVGYKKDMYGQYMALINVSIAPDKARLKAWPDTYYLEIPLLDFDNEDNERIYKKLKAIRTNYVYKLKNLEE